MNPRVQVGHTVTEEVTGIDIIQSQILIAEGKIIAEAAGKANEDVTLNGTPYKRGSQPRIRKTIIPDCAHAFRLPQGGHSFGGGTAIQVV